jgi:hypothetical protein
MPPHAIEDIKSDVKTRTNSLLLNVMSIPPQVPFQIITNPKLSDIYIEQILIENSQEKIIIAHEVHFMTSFV